MSVMKELPYLLYISGKAPVPLVVADDGVETPMFVVSALTSTEAAVRPENPLLFLPGATLYVLFFTFLTFGLNSLRSVQNS